MINAFVGSMVSIERTILPLLAKQDFGLTSDMAIISFLMSFGIVKALANLFAGRMGDRFGRKRLLVSGWVIGLAVPLQIIVAPSWGGSCLPMCCWASTRDSVGPRRSL